MSSRSYRKNQATTMPSMIASIETISRYRSSRRCSKSVIVPSGGSGGGLSHFKLKWMGRPLIVKDTADENVDSGVVTVVAGGRILVSTRRLLVAGAAGRL